jgi:hypothetical protein
MIIVDFLFLLLLLFAPSLPCKMAAMADALSGELYIHFLLSICFSFSPSLCYVVCMSITQACMRHISSNAANLQKSYQSLHQCWWPPAIFLEPHWITVSRIIHTLPAKHTDILRFVIDAGDNSQ